MHRPALDVNALTRRFGRVLAVDRVSFQVEEGEIFGFMGHNGAGKTTVLRMLLGLTRPDSGAGSVLGHDIVTSCLQVRALTGYLPGSYALPGEMTARGFLHYVAAMFALSRDQSEARVEGLLERFGLRAHADRPLRGYSHGMTQKIGLAQALLNEPRILLLDEPTAGLDPLGRHELLELLREQSETQKVTVVFSSHILSDVESLCRRVAILHQGRLVACGDLQSLKQEHDSETTEDLYLSLARKQASA